MTLSVETLARAIAGGLPPSDRAFTKARRVLTAIEQAGYVVVPMEATPEMIAATLPLVGAPSRGDRVAGRKAIAILAGGDNGPNGDTAAAELARDWANMLSAAPKIQHSEGE